MTPQEERAAAISAYADHVKGIRSETSPGYDGHERTLLIIGYAAGWDDAMQARIVAAREQVAEQIAQAIEAEYVDSPWIRTAIDIARRHAKGDIDGWLEQRDAAVARAEAAEQAVQRVRVEIDRLARLIPLSPSEADVQGFFVTALRRALDGTP